MKFSEKLAAAAGSISVAAVPAVAGAAVVHKSGSISLTVPSVPLNGTAFVPWDVDGNGSNDFFLVGSRNSFNLATGGGVTSGTDALLGVANGPVFPTVFTGLPASGNQIAATSTSYPGAARFFYSENLLTAMASYSYVFQPFAAALAHYAAFIATTGGATYSFSTGYAPGGLSIGLNKIGFQFDIGGNTHFGVADLIVHSGPNPGIEIDGWAYEDQADTDIHVTPVPSSGVAALTLLGLGAAGMRRLRKSKAAA